MTHFEEWEWPDKVELNLQVSLVYRDAKKQFEKAFVERVLTMVEGKVTTMATLIGKERKDTYELISRSGLVARDFRPPE